MIKGVNKQVVDVTEPESAYFERVLFFVKPEFYGMGDAGLREQAAAVIRTTVRPPRNRDGRRVIRLSAALRVALAAVLGAGAAILVQMLLR